jgi:hypothetical protein
MLSLNSYAAKDTIWVLFFGQKRPKTIVIGIIVHDCLETINNMWFLGKRESVNDHRHHHKFIKYENRLRKEDKMPRLTYQASKIFTTSA